MTDPANPSARERRLAARRRRWRWRLRLADPDAGRPYPPPGFENIITMGLFAATALAVAIIVLSHLPDVGPSAWFGLIGACAYLLALAFGAFRVRPREGGERWFRLWLAPVTLQALFLAVSSYHGAMAEFGRATPSKSIGFLVLAPVLCTFTGIGASFVLQSVARRAGDLIFAQLFGPGLLLMGAAATAIFL